MILILITGCKSEKDNIDDNDANNIESELDKENDSDNNVVDDDDKDGEMAVGDKETGEDDKDMVEEQVPEGDKETGDDNEDKETIAAPDFTLSDGKGNSYTLSDYKGKLVFVNFFTTWCGYCKDEMPDFQKIHEKYKDDDVAIIAVDVQHDASEKPIDEVIEWAEDLGITFPVVFDEDGTATDNYYINGYPTTYVISKEGVVIGYVNAMDEQDMEKLISMYR
jgi:cytochrome c-type biogenesis protein